MSEDQDSARGRKVVDLLIAALPVAAVLAVQYRDEITQARMWVKSRLTPADVEGPALRQVQREISLMEHGGDQGDAC